MKSTDFVSFRYFGFHQPQIALCVTSCLSQELPGGSKPTPQE